MEQPKYTYIFDAISDRPSSVRLIEHHTGMQSTFRVSVDDEQVICGTGYRVLGLVADIIDLAVSIHIADRFSSDLADLPRHIHIVLPVRHPEMLCRAPVLEKLCSLLYWYTSDNWEFEFDLRRIPPRWSELQHCFDLGDEPRATEVALWSGGLDSAAGLVNRLSMNDASRYTLIGTGSNAIMHGTQRRTARRVAAYASRPIRLIQLPFMPTESGHLHKSRSQRTRGLVFMLIGAACAMIEQQHTLHVYENGVGAINLPFRASEVGLDHSRAVHPISLHRMTDLVSEILGTPFRFRNPFLFHTKAQLCEALATSDGLELIAETITCDQLHRAETMQCGYCSSCILRQQALAAARIADPTNYYVASLVPLERSRKSSYGNHLRAMLWQVQSLHQLVNRPDAGMHLARYYLQLQELVDETAADEGLTPEAMLEGLGAMYRRYVAEWESVQSTVTRVVLQGQQIRQVA